MNAAACTQQTGAWDHIAINVCDIDAAFEYVTSGNAVAANLRAEASVL